jgi:hypothetical protein
MHVATNGEWTGSFGGSSVAIDGINVWDAIMDDEDSPRTSIIHLMDTTSNYSLLVDSYVLNYHCVKKNEHDVPTCTYDTDQNPNNSFLSCDVISLVDFSDTDSISDDFFGTIAAVNSNYRVFLVIAVIICCIGPLLCFGYLKFKELHAIKRHKSG